MKLQENSLNHGFRIKQIQLIQEVKGTGYEMVHEKSGARLYYLKTNDDNKVFSITFRTPPNDSTGLPHILEHSVLCGSEKFPLKDPFVELAKGSMNTFLNAMTFSDKTMYPIASRNEKDFMNLMDVYLNAVFYPNLHKQPEILQQEGWHYTLGMKDEPLRIKGVVYNEMKGAFSTPEQVLFRKIQETLFPETPYGYESGGDPDVIPELTQEKFAAYHQTYYHPANAFIYLYGNGEIEKYLSFINENYLIHFNQISIDSKIPVQKPFSKLERIEIEYPIGAEETEDEKTYVSLNYVTGIATDPENHLAMDMLNYLLLGTPAAPLKRALLKAELGKDVFGSFDNSILQPIFSIIIKNTELEKAETFQRLVENTLREIVSNGIDKELIESVINIYEFKLREADYGRYPRGLIYGMKMLESWLYEEDPSVHLKYEALLDKIKSSMLTSYFEDLIRNKLLENMHGNMLIIKPVKGLNEAKEESLKKTLQLKKEKMNEEEINRIMIANRKLENWQNTPHTEAELSVMPLLSLTDLDPEPEEIPLNITHHEDVKILNHSIFTNRIQYLGSYFDLASISMDELPYVSLATTLLGRINTQQYDYETLSKKINLHTGGISFHTDAFSVKDQQNQTKYRMVIRAKSLTEKNSLFWDLLTEILFRTTWQDHNRIKEVVREMKSRMEMGLLQEGHLAAARRSLAAISPESAFKELTGGIAYYHFLCDLERSFDEKISQTTDKIQEILSRILTRQNSLFSFTGEESDYKPFEDGLIQMTSQMPSHPVKASISHISPLQQGNEGLYLSSKVQYVAKSSNFITHGYQYSGSHQVLRTICSLDYLWKQIRVSGGAYGAMAGFFRNGNGYFVSYRDPNLEETLQVFDKLPDYLKQFNVNHREMTKYIIGTMSRIDVPLTPGAKGERGDALFLANISMEDLKKERMEVIGTTVETIRSYADMIHRMMSDNHFCVIGSEAKIKQSAHLFDKTLQIIS